MGYKGTFRSINGAINRSARASQVAANKRRRGQDRYQRQIQALHEKLQQKQAIIAEKRTKPIRVLKELYAVGKVDKKQFHNLAQRDAEITIDLIIFGRNAGVKLGERYLTGKIDSQEFESLKNEILGRPEAERDSIVEEFQSFISEANDFLEKARINKQEAKCNFCGRPKKFFSPLFKENDVKLCGSCKLKLRTLSTYPGYVGKYYETPQIKLNIDQKTDLVLTIKSEHLLNYS